MDLPSLAVILQAALSPNPDERKAAEQSLNQVSLFIIWGTVLELRFVIARLCIIQYDWWNSVIRYYSFNTPLSIWWGYCKSLWIIIATWRFAKPLAFTSRTSLLRIGRLTIPVRWFWCVFDLFVGEILISNCLVFSGFDVDEQQKILPADKDLVRDHILVFVPQLPPLLRWIFRNYYCFISCKKCYGVYDGNMRTLFLFRMWNSLNCLCWIGYSWVNASRHLWMLITPNSGLVFWTGWNITYKINKSMELCMCCGFLLGNTSKFNGLWHSLIIFFSSDCSLVPILAQLESTSE